MEMSFTNKVIIVTGASSGIGADAAKHFAKLGGKLCLVARNEKLLKIVSEEIIAFGSSEQPLVIVADVTKDPERIIQEAVKHFGKLNVLVNNAGIYQLDSVINFNITQFDAMLSTNLKAVAILTSLAVPYLEKTKGNIVNVSSVAGMRAIPGMLSYCISKAALDQFTKCVALELAPKGIRVNSINPAMIRTPIFEKTGISAAEANEEMEAGKYTHPMGRIGEPIETSEAIAYIASDSASFITGVLLPVDGGYMVK
ncbi:3-oxoacyl-[acyl-carrier-protein] reductase FabG-like [Bradysia coprophila]|uniref:3-oxoacyl-[acyl-carrier-protein] reductase FabG-like n=1 Tax=Bradysia coprophila TaxID=38358 RepID=UPI00187D7517|nr:3-oxoacyl-[acyl-carrier-protein] reductase FabG-like [Bradysia coprophila]